VIGAFDANHFDPENSQVQDAKTLTAPAHETGHGSNLNHLSDFNLQKTSWQASVSSAPATDHG
jgi:hypothetical protein